MAQEFKMIAKTFMGLENVLAKELTELGANNIETGRRMVEDWDIKNEVLESHDSSTPTLKTNTMNNRYMVIVC